MSSFPDVLSATLNYRINTSNNNTVFTVPPQYAFAVVQVRFSVTFGTGSSFDSRSSLENLIIKGGETYELGSYSSSLTGLSHLTQMNAKITALCHKKPS